MTLQDNNTCYDGIVTKLDVDHINNNPLDNRKINLRICNRSQNLINRRLLGFNTSGFRGVSKFRNKWQAYINYDRKRIHLGHFENKTDAAKAYNIAALKYHGEFVRLNNV